MPPKNNINNVGGGSPVPSGPNQPSSKIKAANAGSNSEHANSFREPMVNISGRSVYSGKINIGEIWSPSECLDPADNAKHHFEKHKSEFPDLPNYRQYSKKALEILKNSGTAVFKTRFKNFHYNRDENIFVLTTSGGKIKTMFRPEMGETYWERVKSQNV